MIKRHNIKRSQKQCKRLNTAFVWFVILKRKNKIKTRLNILNMKNIKQLQKIKNLSTNLNTNKTNLISNRH